MRYLHILLTLLMLMFIAVQYNDPDGLMWMAIYLVPALWNAVAAFRTTWLARTRVRAVLLASIAAAIAATAWFWPTTPAWWTMAVWYEAETAREGMGLMIVSLVLIAVLISSMRPAARHMAAQ